MPDRNSVRRFCALFSLILIIPLFSSTALEARTYKVCKPGLLGGKYHFHHGIGEASRSKNLAMKSAAKKWSGFTEWEYGKSWANIRKADRVSYKCRQLGSRSWRCEVNAVPCARIKR